MSGKIRQRIALWLLVLRELVLGRVKLGGWYRWKFEASHNGCAGDAVGFTPWGAMWNAAHGCSMCNVGPNRTDTMEEEIESLRSLTHKLMLEKQRREYAERTAKESR